MLGKTLAPGDKVRRPAAVESLLHTSRVRMQEKITKRKKKA